MLRKIYISQYKYITKRKRSECYRFDKKSGAFSRPDEGDGSALPLQLLTDIIRVQLQKSVIVIEECYHQNVCRQVKWTCHYMFTKSLLDIFILIS